MIDKSEVMAGSETTSAFPVYLEKYKQTVWVPSDFVHMI
jgi:hypothetical protein